MKYRKKPVVIDALHFTGHEVSGDVLEFAQFRVTLAGNSREDYWVEIPTLEGVMKAKPGDWIIRGIKGELYPCKPDIFAATYEPA